jgi:hypothetical protein
VKEKHKIGVFTVTNSAGSKSAGSVPGWTSNERRFKVFISYSRQDSEPCAKRLVEALERLGLAAKLDTRDLDFGEKWRRQLRDFIRHADAVIYIVSPKSIESKWCRWEVAQVAAQSKRLVPVVHIPVPADLIPAEISDIQLFQLRSGTDFRSNTQYDALVRQLVEGLQKDRAWLKEHTRLNEVAFEWQANDRKRDYLLRGSMLSAAERWLAARPQTAPPPSSFQLQFVSASQTWAKQRMRRWAVGLAAVATGGLTLAGLAYWQRTIAVTNEQESARRNFELRKSLGTMATVLSRDPQHETEAVEIGMQATAPGSSDHDRLPSEAFAGLTAALSRIYAVQPLYTTSVVATGNDGKLITIGENQMTQWMPAPNGLLRPSGASVGAEVFATMNAVVSTGIPPKIKASIGGHFASLKNSYKI